MVMTSRLSEDTLELFEVLDFEPSEGQLPFVACKKRFIIATGGQQSGKSLSLSGKFVDRWQDDMDRWQPCVAKGLDPYNCPGHPEGTPGSFRCDPTLIYWLVGKAYNQVEEELDLITEYMMRLGMPVKLPGAVFPKRLEVKFPKERRARLRLDTKSEADPETAFTRVSPHGIVACEGGQLTLKTYHLLNSRTIGKQGWLMIPGTIERSQPWFPAMAGAWAVPDDEHQSFEIPTWTNTALFPGGRNDPEILRMERESPHDFFMERIAGKAVPPEGLVMKEFSLEVNVRDDVLHVPGEKVYIWVDPGYQRGEAAHAVEIAHFIGGQARVFDEIHEYGLTTDDIIDICMQRDWWGGGEKVLAIDPYYKDVHHAMGSVAETWQKRTGLVCSDKNKRVQVNEADNRMRAYLKVDQILKQPKLVFSPKCLGVLSEFGAVPSPHSPSGEVLAYKWALDTSGNQIGRTPRSRYCDGIRAVETGLIEHVPIASMTKRGVSVTYKGGQASNRTGPRKPLADQYAEDKRRRDNKTVRLV